MILENKGSEFSFNFNGQTFNVPRGLFELNDEAYIFFKIKNYKWNLNVIEYVDNKKEPDASEDVPETSVNEITDNELIAEQPETANEQVTRKRGRNR